jgi:hypothetical protein
LTTDDARVRLSADDLPARRSADDEQARREALSCAPFVTASERVEPVWRVLAIRAGQMGFVVGDLATTTDPALHLLVDGRACWPVATADGRYVFVLPRCAAPVHLMSRAAAPCEVEPWVEDRRCLGVAVERIVLAGPAGRFEMAADHPALADGWWAAERDGLKLWRWTNGNAVLPLPAGVGVVEIHLGGANIYLSGADAVAALSPGWFAASHLLARISRRS